MPSHIEAQAWRKGSAQDASDDYSSGVVAGFNLARLTPEIDLALISLEHNIIQLWGNQIAERSRAELGAKAARKMRAVYARKKKLTLWAYLSYLLEAAPSAQKVFPKSLRRAWHQSATW